MAKKPDYVIQIFLSSKPSEHPVFAEIVRPVGTREFSGRSLSVVLRKIAKYLKEENLD